jgi:hypothetical protein
MEGVMRQLRLPCLVALVSCVGLAAARDDASTAGQLAAQSDPSETVVLVDTTSGPPVDRVYGAPPAAVSYAIPADVAYRPQPRASYRPQFPSRPTTYERQPVPPPVVSKAGLIVRCRSELGLAAAIPQAGECTTYITALWDGYTAGLGAMPHDVCPPAGTTSRRIAASLLESERAGLLAGDESARDALLTTMRAGFPCR